MDGGWIEKKKKQMDGWMDKKIYEKMDGWSSVYECQRVECAFTSPVRTECGMFVMYCMQCCMSVSAVLQCVDVVSRGGMQMFAIVICLVLLMCTLTI